MKRKLTVVTPNYNRPDLIEALVADLEKQEEVSTEIIVVDDCSNDDSVETIRKQFPTVKVLESERNQGPTVARNRGIREASNQIIVGIDSDVTLPDPLLLSKVVDTLESLPKKHGLALRVMDSEGKKDDIPRWWHPRSPKTFADTEFETDFFSGTAFAFWKEDLIAIEGFQESIFQYYEENLLAARFIEHGGRLLYKPQLRVLHHPGERPAYSKHRLYHNPRSQIIFAYNSLPFFRAIWFITSRLTLGIWRSATNNGIKHFIKGVKDGISTSFRTENLRRPLSKDALIRIKEIRSGL